MCFQEQSHGAGDSAGGLLCSVPAGKLKKKKKKKKKFVGEQRPPLVCLD